jgi:polysaccharide deacetylase family protein (PEP-CTERM system associated)
MRRARETAARHPVVNAMSVDVEDYYQVYAFARTVRREDWPRLPARVEANTERVLELFAKAGVRATFFTLGCVAERHPTLIRRIVAAGHELASHGFAHYHVWEQDPRAFREDIVRTKRTLEDAAGCEVRGYRAASFSINRETWWAFVELAAAGYRYSSSVNPIRHDHYGVPDAPRFPFAPDGTPQILEIPISTVELAGRRVPCGGGGYFRLLPYAVFRWALGRLHRDEGRPSVFYFHPWEIDPAQPRIAGAPWRSRFRHYVNLHAMEAKLRRLLDDFRWDRVDAVFLADKTASALGTPLAARLAGSAA